MVLDLEKRAYDESADPNANAFVPLSKESYTRRDKPAIQLLNTIINKEVAGFDFVLFYLLSNRRTS